MRKRRYGGKSLSKAAFKKSYNKVQCSHVLVVLCILGNAGHRRNQEN